MTTNPRFEDEGPILPGSPLGRALGGGAAPRLSPGFADRVLVAAKARPAPLAPLRRAARWRAGRRLAFGLAGVAALASAAAATGLLQQVVPAVPSAKAVWAGLIGPTQSAPAERHAPAKAATPAAVPSALAITGPVDTPEELGEAFRRADQLREARRAGRREVIERRIADALAQRKAAGLADPSPAELAALRERLAMREARRDAAVDERVKVRREALERRVENGEALTGEDFVRPLRPGEALHGGSETFERLRSMTPAERREAVRTMPASERAALREELRARRAANLASPPDTAPSPSGAASPSD
jgi:hypothetical protein